MTLKDYVRVLRKRWLVVAATTLLSLAVAIILTLTATPKYEAATDLFVTMPGANNIGETYEGNLFSQQRVASYAALVTSEDVLSQTVNRLKLDTTPDKLAEQISATAIPETVLINVTVSDSSPTRAAEIANTVSDVFVSRVAGLERPHAATTPMTRVVVAQQASAPETRTSPNNTMNVALGGIVGVLAGFALALLAERFTRTIGDRRDVETLTNAAVLATIPRARRPWDSPIVDFNAPSTASAEGYRCLAAVIGNRDGAPPRVTMVTSPDTTKQKTAAVINVAAALADSGATVCVVDGDLRARTLSCQLGNDSGIGLSTILKGEAALCDALQPIGDMTFLGAGPAAPKPGHLLADSFAAVIDELCKRFDHVIVDTPQLPGFSDALVVSRSAGSTVIIARPGRSKRQLLTDAVELLHETSSTELSIVLAGAGRRWSFNRDNIKPTKITEITLPINGQMGRAAGNKHAVVQLGDIPWAVRHVSASTNGH